MHRRECRRLLNLIDHLPGHSYYAEAVAGDEEHARMLLEAYGNRPQGEYSPPRSTWSPEVDMLAQVLDAIRNLTAVTVNANGGKAKEIKPVPRPRSMMAKAQRDQRLAKHRALVARVLPEHREDDG